jgi:uncharacterized membrane protein YgdD (TMEM256/DUF423 family)
MMPVLREEGTMATSVSRLLLIAGMLAFMAVGMGAFAAHYLRERLSERLLNVFETAVQYQAWHCLAIIGCAVLIKIADDSVCQRFFYRAACFFVGGIVCFSGSLYALVLTGVKWFGPITPIGGLLFLLGWGLFAYAGYRFNSASRA